MADKLPSDGLENPRTGEPVVDHQLKPLRVRRTEAAKRAMVKAREPVGDYGPPDIRESEPEVPDTRQSDQPEKREPIGAAETLESDLKSIFRWLDWLTKLPHEEAREAYLKSPIGKIDQVRRQLEKMMPNQSDGGHPDDAPFFSGDQHGGYFFMPGHGSRHDTPFAPQGRRYPLPPPPAPEEK